MKPSTLSSSPNLDASRSRIQEHCADLALVQRAHGGHAPSVEQVLERLTCVRRFVSHIDKRAGKILEGEEQEDVIQESMLAIWRKLALFEGRSSFETWVYRFCFLEVSTRLRRKYRRPLLLEEVEQADPETPFAASKTMEYERLYRSLEVLGPPNAEVIRLKHLQSLTFDEISERTGVSVNTAKTQYYRGMKSLRGLYGPELSNSEGER